MSIEHDGDKSSEWECGVEVFYMYKKRSETHAILTKKVKRVTISMINWVNNCNFEKLNVKEHTGLSLRYCQNCIFL